MTIDHRFLVKLEEDNSFGEHVLRIEASVVVMTVEGVRNPSSSSWSDDSELAELGVRGHMSSNYVTPHFLGADKLEYYNVYSMDLHRAEGMVKLLRRTNKRLLEAETRFGYPTDTAARFAHFAYALGMKGDCFGWYLTKARSLYDSSTFAWGDVNRLRCHLETETEKWRETYNIRLKEDA